jgi:enamine deaminase RidA (YjgF/YER057c/UK114 family)
MSKQRINPAELAPTLQYGFSQIVTTRGGKTVYLAGQVGWDENGEIVGKGDFQAQLQRTFENIATAMRAAGGTMQDVVSMRIYTVNESAEERTQIRQALRGFFPEKHAPATTWLGVRALSNPDFLIEIEAIGVIEEAA